jgi:hypothetical protein
LEGRTLLDVAIAMTDLEYSLRLSTSSLHIVVLAVSTFVGLGTFRILPWRWALCFSAVVFVTTIHFPFSDDRSNASYPMRLGFDALCFLLGGTVASALVWAWSKKKTSERSE